MLCSLFAMLSEDEVRRIAERPTSDPRAREALTELLRERRHLVAVIQGLARQLHHLRERLKQASSYLDSLVERAESTAKAPWPAKVPCPRCGAAIDRVTVDYRPDQGHALEYRHPDGSVCDAEERRS